MSTGFAAPEHFRAAALREMLEAARLEGRAPGAALAIMYNGAVVSAAVGHANAPAGIEADEKTLFPVGSITKVLTAAMVHQLEVAGALNFESRLVDLLPELRLVDRDAAGAVTVRQLLDHSSGLDGDWLVDTGRGEDALQKLVGSIGPVCLLHEPGAMFSYCNLGYLLLGRIVEKLTGDAWDDVLRSRLLGPLGLAEAQTRPERFLRRRFALGHDVNGALAPLWPRSNAASGSRLAMSAADLLGVARLALEAGAGVISAESAARMADLSITTPFSWRYRGWGLGWMRCDRDGVPLVGHDGGVAGVSSFLRIAPEAHFAIALCVNGGDAGLISQAVLEPLLQQGAGVPPAPPLPCPNLALAPDPARFVGVYERNGLALAVGEDGGALTVRQGGTYDGEQSPIAMLPAGDDLFVIETPFKRHAPVFAIGADERGRAVFLHAQDRVYPRAPG